MSSSPPPEPRRRGRWSLRTRLLAGQIALLALACAMIGVVTEVGLRAGLTSQLDQQVRAAAQHMPGASHGPGGPGGPGPGGPPDDLQLCGNSSGTPFHFGPASPGMLGAQIRDGQVLTASIADYDCQRSLPAADYGALLSVPTAGDTTRTVDLGQYGDYDVAAVAHEDGSIVVTGLPLSGVDRTLWTLGWIYGAVGLAALLAAGVVGAIIVRRTLRPLRRVADTASRVAELPLDRGDVALSVRVPDVDTDPNTEVGQVGAALNRMLGHVANALATRQASETRARQFVADASHELRTPLAAIRGYAELTRRGTDEVPAQIAYAMGRVESESARMTILVEDLLLLARLDSGRPLEREPVDLSRLVVDAVSDAHIAGGQHVWRLDLPDEPVLVSGDPARLHQVLANLLTNARNHTPPGTTVTTGVTVADPSWVTLTVADNGPGIPADVLPNVFERFARGDTSRSRAAGSTGLGLAIVAAVVGAHGGAVHVVSERGSTVFTVSLPRAR